MALPPGWNCHFRLSIPSGWNSTVRAKSGTLCLVARSSRGPSVVGPAVQ